MVDLVGTCQSIFDLLVKVKDMMGTFSNNQEDCDRILMLVDTAQAVVEPLKQTQLDIMVNKGMSVALKGLEKALERSLKTVKTCKKKSAIRSYIEANGIAKDLLRVYVDISVNVGQVNLATGINNGLMLASIVKTLADLDAKSLEVIHSHQRQEIKKLVRAYGSSTEYATNQDRKKRGTEKSDVSSRSNNIEETNVPADSNGSHAHLSYAKSTSVKSVDGQGHHGTVNKIISRSIESMTSVRSIDVHPAKPWIVAAHEGRSFFIWDYKKETVVEKVVTKEPSKVASITHSVSQYRKETAPKHWVCSVKFIVQQKWLVVGDGSGYIHVYDYTNTELPEVEKFKAHDGVSVDLLAVHPTKTYLLSSSKYGKSIKLWDWSSGWKQIQKYNVKPTYPDGVVSLKFNPRDSNTFACVTYDRRVKVGNIRSSNLDTKLWGTSKADYFVTCNDRHLMVTLSSESDDAKIQDLETEEVVHVLDVSGRGTGLVAAHPTLPILVTALVDGSVCFWDANTFRLENEVRITEEPDNLALVTDVNDITRLVVTSKSMMKIMEYKFPKVITNGQTGGGNGSHLKGLFG